MNKKIDPNMQPITVYITKEQYREIKVICAIDNLKISHIVIDSIEQFLDKNKSVIENFKSEEMK